jgi:hypothetical protein
VLYWWRMVTEKECTKCKKTKPLSDFYKDSRTKLGVKSRCKHCLDNCQETKKRKKEYAKARRQGPQGDLVRRQERNRAIKTRAAVIKHYGGKCECCGVTDMEFLALDHINGGGNQHRKAYGITSMARWLKANKYPETYRVLCHSCNQAKAQGYCPHEKLPMI